MGLESLEIAKPSPKYAYAPTLESYKIRGANIWKVWDKPKPWLHSFQSILIPQQGKDKKLKHVAAEAFLTF